MRAAIKWNPDRQRLALVLEPETSEDRQFLRDGPDLRNVRESMDAATGRLVELAYEPVRDDAEERTTAPVNTGAVGEA